MALVVGHQSRVMHLLADYPMIGDQTQPLTEYRRRLRQEWELVEKRVDLHCEPHRRANQDRRQATGRVATDQNSISTLWGEKQFVAPSKRGFEIAPAATGFRADVPTALRSNTFVSIR